MDDLELEPVRVVEEQRVVPRRVGVFLRFALDLRADLAQPLGPLVDGAARVGLESEVVEPEPVTVEAVGRVRLRRPQADGGTGPPEVPDRLAALALDLGDAVPP